MKRLRRLILALSLAASGCMTLPTPSPADAIRAQESYPGATVQSLEAGRQTYLSHCGGCHALYSPKSHTPKEWAKAIPEMAGRARLSPAEVEAVTRYLSVMSGAGS